MPVDHCDQAKIELADQLLSLKHLARLVRLVAPSEVDGQWLSALRAVSSVPPVEQGQCWQIKIEIKQV